MIAWTRCIDSGTDANSFPPDMIKEAILNVSASSMRLGGLWFVVADQCVDVDITHNHNAMQRICFKACSVC